jgi:hypothetical protein
MKRGCECLHDELCELDWAWECLCHVRAAWREVLAALRGGE